MFVSSYVEIKHRKQKISSYVSVIKKISIVTRVFQLSCVKKSFFLSQKEIKLIYNSKKEKKKNSLIVIEYFFSRIKTKLKEINCYNRKKEDFRINFSFLILF